MSVDVHGITLAEIPTEVLLEALRDVSGDADARLEREADYGDGETSRIFRFLDRGPLDPDLDPEPDYLRMLTVQRFPVDSEAAGPLAGHEGESATYMKLGAGPRALAIMERLVAVVGGFVDDERTDEVTEIAGPSAANALR